MTVAFVLGNGRSRQGLDLVKLQERGKIYGCNRLYQDYPPDVLISTDPAISREIQESGYSLNRVHYTRRPFDGAGAKKISQPYYGWSSGPIAAAIAAESTAERIYLLGFDLSGTENNTFNNIYADTKFYKSSAEKPTFYGNWVKQMIQCVRLFETKTFYRVVDSASVRPNELNLPNLLIMELSEFQKRLNKRKEL